MATLLLRSRRRWPGAFQQHPHLTVVLLLSPALLWLALFVVLPLGMVAYYSVLTRGAWGTVVPVLTLENYRQLADPLFLRIAARTLRLALQTTLLCALLGYPVAYWIAMHGGTSKHFWLFLVMLPFWTSDLVRTYAWMTILADHGLLNHLVIGMGWRHEPLPLLHTEGAVLLGMVYTYLPFMILPLYAALERLNRHLLEAAADLGARPGKQWRRVTLPLSRAGLVSGAILVFVPALGEFLIPELLGGAQVMLLGKFIALKFTGLRHWPLGAAYAMALVLTMGVLLGIAWRYGERTTLRGGEW